MSADKIQFNTRIAEKYKIDIEVEAAKTRQSIETVTETMIAKFFYFYPSRVERKKAYREHLRINKLKHNSDKMPGV
jgi:hypothetical protein